MLQNRLILLERFKNQLSTSARENIGGQQTKQYKDTNFENRINILKVSWWIKWCDFNVLKEQMSQ